MKIDRLEIFHIRMKLKHFFETSFGRTFHQELHNIRLAALPNFTRPGDISASERYWEEDIIDPPVTVTGQGTIRVPTRPGLGHEAIESRVERVTVRKERIL